MNVFRPSWLKLFFTLLLLIGLPVFIWAVATQRIELRKKADFTGPTLAFMPETVSGGAGLQTQLGISLNTNTASVSGVKLHITYNPQVIHIDEFTPGSFLPVVVSPAVIATDTGTITVELATSIPDTGVDGSNIIGSIKFTLINNYATSINFSDATVVTAVGQPSNALANKTGVQINSGNTPPPSVSPIAPPPPSGTPSVEPACSTNGSACTYLANCPVCTTGQCPMYACLGQPGTCQNNVCVPNPTPTPTPRHYCAGANGSPCTTGWFTLREDCQQDSLYLSCPHFSQQAQGTCQNNVCVFPTPPPYLPQCTYSQTPCSNCDALLACPPATPTPTPTPSPTPPPGCYVLQSNPPITVCPSSTPPPPPLTQKLEIWVRLAGVSGGTANGARLTSVKFYLRNGTVWGITTPLTLAFQSGTTSGGGSGVYSTTVDITNPIAAGTQFRLSVKGEKHGAIKFCKSAEQYGPCGDNEYITMPSTTGTYRVYLTGIPLPAGDLNQDGVINQTDVNIVTAIFRKPSSQITADDKLKADVNYDGYVDNYDLGLILQSLATRYDE